MYLKVLNRPFSTKYVVKGVQVFHANIWPMATTHFIRVWVQAMEKYHLLLFYCVPECLIGLSTLAHKVAKLVTHVTDHPTPPIHLQLEAESESCLDV